MPKDVIQRAINKATSGAENYAEVSFEGTGPGGVAIFVECLTDNNQRTVSSVRSIFRKRGGELGNKWFIVLSFWTGKEFSIWLLKISKMDH